MRKILVLLALAVLLTSGCTGRQYRGAGIARTGLVVTQFAPEEKEVKGEGVNTVELFLALQNIGEAIATNIQVDLFNYGDFVGRTSSNQSSLDPPQGERQGEKGDFTFVLTVPKREMGIMDTVDIGARIAYDYNSRGTTDVYVVPKAEWKTKEGLGAKGVRTESVSTNGPIAVAVGANQPVVVSDDTKTFSLHVDVDNLGIGSVKSSLYGYDVVDAVDLVVPAGFTVGDYCDFKGDLGPQGGTLTLQQNPERLKLTMGRHKSLICRLNVNNTRLENTYPFMAVARYRYQIDGFTSVMITGTE